MWWFVARLAISAGLLGWLLHRLNLAKIAQSFAHADIAWVIVAVLLTAPVIVLISWKWQILLRAAGVRESLWRLVRMNLVGGFYSLILPGEETGQLAKGVILARHSQGDAVAASIVVDEILGTLSIFTIALVTLGLTHPFPLRLPIAGAIAFMLAVFLALLALAVVPGCHGLARAIIDRGLPAVSAALVRLLAPLLWLLSVLLWAAWPSAPRRRRRAPDMPTVAEVGQQLTLRLDRSRARFVCWLEPFWGRLGHYHRNVGAMTAAFFITVLAHLVANISVYGTMHAVGANVSFLDVCWVVAAISALVTIPITVSGFGIREGANVIILGQLGVAGSNALAVSLLAFAIGFVWSLPGGLLQFGIRSKKTEQLEALEADGLGLEARPEPTPAAHSGGRQR